jgi:hypothetical protein
VWQVSDAADCEFARLGCTDETALNFDSSATLAEGCIYMIRGCDDSIGLDYVPINGSHSTPTPTE